MNKVTIRFNFNINLNKLPIPKRLKLQMHGIMQEIKRKSASGDCIFRGETRHYNCNQVSSTLYRKCKGISVKTVGNNDMEIIQSNLLYSAMMHDMNDPAKEEKRPELYKHDDTRMDNNFIEKNFEVLTEIQHWGGSTNLIDFTEDFRIALFFACDGDYNKDGRIIIKSRSSVQGLIRKPEEPRHRVESQKSVFISPPKGFIKLDQNSVVNISKELKKVVLKLLALQDPPIIEETIYGDLHGFIKMEDRYLQASVYLHRALVFEKKADDTQSNKSKHFFLEKAIKLYEESIAKFPSFQKHHFRCARLYGMLGKFEEAKRCAKEATEWWPYDHQAFGLLGKCYFDSDDIEMAILNFNESIQLNKDYTDGYIMRGDAYSRNNNHEQAINDYNKVIELEPNDHRAYTNRAVAYLKKEDPDQAIKDSTKSLQIKPDNIYAITNRGSAYLQKDEFDLAIEDLTAATKLDLCNFTVFAHRGYAYLCKADCENNAHDYDNSAHDFHKALELETSYHVAHLYLGNIYAHKEALDLAVRHYGKLIDIGNDWDASNAHLFIIPNAKMKALTKKQLETEGYGRRAEVYLRMKKWKYARADLISAQKLGAKPDGFKNAHSSVENFEKKYGVMIPKDLAELLLPIA